MSVLVVGNVKRMIFKEVSSGHLSLGCSEPEELHSGDRGRGRSRGRAPCCGPPPRAPYRPLLYVTSVEKTEEEDRL